MSDCKRHVVTEVVTDYAVVVEPEPEQVVVTMGDQGPPGPGAFDLWLERNPGGTWDEFMSELGSGAIWQQSEW